MRNLSVNDRIGNYKLFLILWGMGGRIGEVANKYGLKGLMISLSVFSRFADQHVLFFSFRRDDNFKFL